MKKHTTHISKAVIALCIFLLGLDFVNFCARSDNLLKTKISFSDFDAVAVLTGGSNRIAKATEIAQANALPLFVSGVNENATSDEVALAAGVDPVFFQCCVTLGYVATSTHGNGLEIAQWAKQNNINNLIIVTSNYHMERALLEMKYSMPNINLAGQSVESPTINTDRWWSNGRSTKRMLVEWAKWRTIQIRDSLSDR